MRDCGLKVSCLQPLRDYEGWVSPQDRADARKRAVGFLDIMRALGTELLLVCSNGTAAPRTTDDEQTAVEDLSWLADEAQRRNLRLCYEALSFAAHRSRWQDAMRIVELCARPNLGLCLDSFNTLAREYADPYVASGKRVNADENVEQSCRELASISSSRIFFLQVADGRYMCPPMTPPTDPSVPPLRPWSRSSRLYPCEQARGGYLPVNRFVDAVMQTGYAGPWSLEVFNDSLSARDASVPQAHAKRGYEGLVRCAHDAHVRAASALASALPRKTRTSAGAPLADATTLSRRLSNSSSCKPSRAVEAAADRAVL